MSFQLGNHSRESFGDGSDLSMFNKEMILVMGRHGRFWFC